MTNQERLQQNNDKIEAIQNKLSNKMLPPPTPLYDTTGDNTDGAMTQEASTRLFAQKSEIPDTSGFITDSQLQAKGYITANDLPPVDASLSTTSTNAVRNSVVTSELNTKAKTDGSNINASSFKTALSLNNVANLKIVTGDTHLSEKNQTISTGLSTVLGFQLTLHENVGTSTNLGAIAYWTQSSGGTVTVTPRSTGNGAYLVGHTFNWVAIGY